MKSRPPAVAGSFYPGARRSLLRTIDDLLADARASHPTLAADSSSTLPNNPPPKALISPHAGYVYSGSMAARGFATLNPHAQPISRVVVAGPAHRVAVRGIAVPSVGAFATPLGKVTIDQAAVGRLTAAGLVVVRDDVHADEHSLEVQLPFLQRLLGEFSLVPLAVGDLPPDEVAEVLEAVWGGPGTLLIISTDLSHYESYERARELDADTVARIMASDASIGDRLACGARPLNGFLSVAANRGLQPTLLGMCNSGDTAGDRRRVVGYVSVAWHEVVAR